MTLEPIVPVGATYNAVDHTWTVAFNKAIVRVDGPVDPAQWKFRRDGAMITPDLVWLDAGNVLCQATLFDGLEIAVRYFGPPPTFGDRRWTPLNPFTWFYYP